MRSDLQPEADEIRRRGMARAVEALARLLAEAPEYGEVSVAIEMRRHLPCRIKTRIIRTELVADTT